MILWLILAPIYSDMYESLLSEALKLHVACAADVGHLCQAGIPVILASYCFQQVNIIKNHHIFDWQSVLSLMIVIAQF